MATVIGELQYKLTADSSQLENTIKKNEAAMAQSANRVESLSKNISNKSLIDTGQFNQQFNRLDQISAQGSAKISKSLAGAFKPDMSGIQVAQRYLGNFSNDISKSFKPLSIRADTTHFFSEVRHMEHQFKSMERLITGVAFAPKLDISHPLESIMHLGRSWRDLTRIMNLGTSIGGLTGGITAPAVAQATATIAGEIAGVGAAAGAAAGLASKAGEIGLEKLLKSSKIPFSTSPSFLEKIMSKPKGANIGDIFQSGGSINDIFGSARAKQYQFRKNISENDILDILSKNNKHILPKVNNIGNIEDWVGGEGTLKKAPKLLPLGLRGALSSPAMLGMGVGIGATAYGMGLSKDIVTSMRGITGGTDVGTGLDTRGTEDIKKNIAIVKDDSTLISRIIKGWITGDETDKWNNIAKKAEDMLPALEANSQAIEKTKESASSLKEAIQFKGFEMAYDEANDPFGPKKVANLKVYAKQQEALARAAVDVGKAQRSLADANELTLTTAVDNLKDAKKAMKDLEAAQAEYNAQLEKELELEQQRASAAQSKVRFETVRGLEERTKVMEISRTGTDIAAQREEIIQKYQKQTRDIWENPAFKETMNEPGSKGQQALAEINKQKDMELADNDRKARAAQLQVQKNKWKMENDASDKAFEEKIAYIEATEAARKRIESITVKEEIADFDFDKKLMEVRKPAAILTRQQQFKEDMQGITDKYTRKNIEMQFASDFEKRLANLPGWEKLEKAEVKKKYDVETLRGLGAQAGSMAEFAAMGGLGVGGPNADAPKREDYTMLGKALRELTAKIGLAGATAVAGTILY
jgi:hypothetical protein